MTELNSVFKVKEYILKNKNHSLKPGDKLPTIYPLLEKLTLKQMMSMKRLENLLLNKF